jgi:hypothetical protein
MSEPTSSNPFVGDDVNDRDDLVDEKDKPELVDRGNHEDVVEDEPPHVNDEGHLVNAEGDKVFTTTEEALKDGSFVLDDKGRMPGIYLDDLEEEQAERRRQAYEKAFKNSVEGKNTVVERQVNVVNSPLPPVTVSTVQEHPITQERADDNVETETDVEESDTAKVG